MSRLIDVTILTTMPFTPLADWLDSIESLGGGVRASTKCRRPLRRAKCLYKGLQRKVCLRHPTSLPNHFKNHMSIAIRDRTIISRHIAPAVQSLQNAGTLIDSAAREKKPSKTKDFARKVLHGTNQIMPVVEGVAELHPVAKAVVMVFKAVFASSHGLSLIYGPKKSITKLETDKMENDDRIAVAMTLFTLQHLSKLSFMPEDLELALGEAFGKLEK
ncbi:hypothetical protein HETIRDRAFT_387835 [Heterobasidion irregulare TC 32-1]|uniref:Uncharacterized protein n=1 Tax=Heterobasidion irregulare (strain TC 32-1) TaxID=747525 RepID=W4JY73_HETIT|nr:uncharacterized protein HETIRDRAFT_387835 [Heterobasidion irregulare TC 32-1]ETW77796.1 hypothetical protein HETIRDRAFT_387835 [Heterobasidion irregulare TC 32-1]